ncbi:MAG: phage/plasmid primase, P4 family [Isosphaeraceae bacterium]
MASVAHASRRGSAVSAPTKPTSAHVSDQAAAAIPAELREKDRWLVWRWHLPKGETKWKKPPVDALSGRLAKDWRDPRTWLSFVDARRLAPELGDGIGYVCDADEVGIDLDRCFDAKGKPKPAAAAHVKALNSYAERSPSGQGLHVLIRGKKPTSKCRVAGIEVYDASSNYLTFTGNHLEGTPRTIERRQEALDALFAAAPEEIPTGGGSVNLSLSDAELLAKARLSDPGFAPLYDLGETDGDASRADFKLAAKLAFWTGKDAARMESLFSSSALGQRGKWTDRADYRKRTIATAIAGCKDVYRPTIPSGSRPSTNGKADPPRRGVAPPGHEDGDSPINHTELGNARRLVQLFGHRLRFCKQLGYWLIFDGTRWCPDQTGEVWRCAKATVRSLAKEAAKMTDGGERKMMLAWAIKSEEKKKIQAMIDLAWSEPGIAIIPDDLDRDPWLLNCPNGTVDLRTGNLRAHRAEDLITKITRKAYRPEASRERWSKTLAEIQPDPEMVAYIKRAVGYSCCGDIGEHALFIAFGKGRNGKNTVLDPIAAVLNDYSTTSDPRVFLRSGKNDHPTALADLFGRRYVMTDEVDEGEQLAEALVKRLTGNPRLKSRFLYHDNFEFDITCKIWMPVNHRPDVRGQDEGIWSRIRTIPFEVYFPPEKRIRNLARTLVKEEGEGILAWMVEGCLEWQREGLKEPAKVLEAMKEYRHEQDVMTAFLGECCLSWLEHEVLRDQAREKASDLYARYAAWCKENGEKNVLTGRKFGSEMTTRGYILKPSNGVQYRHGIALNPAAQTAKPTNGGDA